ESNSENVNSENVNSENVNSENVNGRLETSSAWSAVKSRVGALQCNFKGEDKGRAKNASDTIMKSSSMIDRFLFKVFTIAKSLSALIIGICILVAVLAGVGLVVSGSSFEVPKFSTYLEIVSGNQSRDGSIEAGLSVEEKYGDRVNAIVKKYNFTPEGYDWLIDKIISTDEEFREEYVDGFEDFLEDAQKYVNENGEKAKTSVIDASNEYKDLFDASLRIAKISKMESASSRLYLLGAIAVSVLVLLAFVMIPLLILIEKNTRKD
ncbi:MAG: hypothetical protein KAG93_05815, partial [Desulfuromusa sp.]|nr:hypothetical protein [Desulfuromusa sp.]